MLNVPVDKVAPPNLHILLGLMKNHHEQLEELADKLDQMIEGQHEDQSIGEGETFRMKGGNWREAHELQKSLDELEAQQSFEFIYERENEDARREKTLDLIERIERMYDEIEFKELEMREGPIASQLDPIMDEAGVVYVRQFKRSYLGNHCHKYFVNKVYGQCTAAIRSKTRTLTLDTDIIKFADEKNRIL